jgi:hypothetical protein
VALEQVGFDPFGDGGYAPLIHEAAEKYDIPVDRLRAVIATESNFDPNAVSRAGAQGLTQLMPATAKELGVRDPFDPAQNIDGGARYLKEQFDRFGNWDDAHAAYNAGPARVSRGGDLPAETRGYVQKIDARAGPSDLERVDGDPFAQDEPAPSSAPPDLQKVDGDPFAGSPTQPKSIESVLGELAAMPLAERATRIAMGIPIGAVETVVQMAAQVPQMATQAAGFVKALAQGKISQKDFDEATASLTPKWVSDLAGAESLQPETYAGSLMSSALGEGFHQAGRAAAAPGAGVVASAQAIAAGEGTEGARKRFTDLYEKIAPVTEQMLNAGMLGTMAVEGVRRARAEAPAPIAEDPVEAAKPVLAAGSVEEAIAEADKATSAPPSMPVFPEEPVIGMPPEALLPPDVEAAPETPAEATPSEPPLAPPVETPQEAPAQVAEEPPVAAAPVEGAPAAEAPEAQPAPRALADMTPRELELAARLTRSDARRTEVTAELARRGEQPEQPPGEDLAAMTDGELDHALRLSRGIRRNEVATELLSRAPRGERTAEVPDAEVPRDEEGLQVPAGEQPEPGTQVVDRGAGDAQPPAPIAEGGGLPADTGDHRPGPGEVGLEDFTTPEGLPKTFTTRKLAEAYVTQNRSVPADFIPRQTEDGRWAISRERPAVAAAKEEALSTVQKAAEAMRAASPDDAAGATAIVDRAGIAASRAGATQAEIIEAISGRTEPAAIARYARTGAEDLPRRDRAMQRMDEMVGMWEKGSLKDDTATHLGDTPRALQILGAPDMKLYINGATVKKVLGDKHGHQITPEMLRQIPGQLLEPALVFRPQDPMQRLHGGFVVGTELLDKTGKPVIVPIHVRKVEGRLVANSIASVYGYEDGIRAMEVWANNGDLLYYDKSKTAAPSSTLGQPPGEGRFVQVVQLGAAANPKLLSDADVVKKWGAMFRRGPEAPETTGMQKGAVQEALAPTVEKTRVPIDVHQSVDELRRQPGLEDAPDDTKGVYHNGRIHVVADNIRDALDAQRTVARHEVTHAGIDVIYGDSRAREVALTRVVAANPKLRELAAAWRDQYGAEFAAEAKQRGMGEEAAARELRLTAFEEALAHFAQDGNEVKGWQAFAAAIQKGLRSMGLHQLADWMEGATSAEAMAFLDQARRATETAPRGDGRLSPVFQRESPKFARTADDLFPQRMAKAAAALKSGMSEETRQREIFRGGFRAAMASLERFTGSVDAALKDSRALVDTMPVAERWKAMHEFQTGGVGAISDTRLRPFFSAWKANVDQRTAKMQKWGEGYLKETLPNYFSQSWKDPKSALEWYQRLMAKGPLEGRKSFLKQRTYASYQEGMSWKVFHEDGSADYFKSEKEAKAAALAGDTVKPPLEPLSQNFVDIAQLSLQQMDKFIAMHEVRRWLDKRGWVKSVKQGEAMPDGYAKVDDPAFRSRATFPVTDADGKPAAASIAYDYAVPQLIAKDVNNYLDPGLYRFGLWKSFRYGQNLLLSARLGLSAFHAGFTTVDTLVSHVDAGARYMLMGEFGQATKMLAKAIVSPIESPREGTKYLKQFYGEQAADPNTAAILNFLTQGGARGRMDPTDFNNSWVKLKRAWADGDLKGTAMEALPATIEGVMRPIMHYLVPAQKMTARVLLAKLELDRVAHDLGQKRGEYAKIVNAMGEDAMRQISYRVVQQVDDRLGQVAYANLFWNKFAKDVAQASIQSVGWNVGTVNVIFGGMKDAAKIFKPEELVAPLDKAGRVRDATMARVTGRLSYLIALNLTVGMAGASLQYLLTGEWPEDLRSYFFPKTGRKNPDGSDERMSLPSYVKDEYAFANHPLTTLGHKLHPAFSMISELLHNEDFYGNEIVNPDDPWTKAAAQVAAYLGKSVLPYSIQNVQQNAKKGGSVGMALAPLVGVTPAPSSVSRTPFESYVADAYSSSFHRSLTPEAAEKGQARRDALDAIRKGEQPDLTPFTPRERASIYHASRTPIQEQRYARLGLQQKISAYLRASPEEREQFKLLPLLQRDFNAHQRDLSDEDRARVQEILSGG